MLHFELFHGLATSFLGPVLVGVETVFRMLLQERFPLGLLYLLVGELLHRLLPLFAYDDLVRAPLVQYCFEGVEWRLPASLKD